MRIFNVVRRTLCRFRAWRSALVAAPCEFSIWIANRLAVFGGCPRWHVERLPNSAWNRKPSRCFCGRGSSAAWNVPQVLLALDGRLCWRVERPQNSARDGRPSRCFWRAAALAGTWSVLRILFVIDEPLVDFGGRRRWRVWSLLRILFGIGDPLSVLGGWRRWRVERLANSVRNRRPSRGFGQVAALARGASCKFFS